MAGKTYAEKILGAPCGSIVFKKPDLVLTHDNTASIANTFKKMGGQKIFDPKQMLIVLDHNAPPTSAKLANDYQFIREVVKEQGIDKFHDIGQGICHQLVALYAQPNMIIVGSDSHTCTAGAFNAFAAGIDRTEAAGLWKQGETWFRVPESMKITLNGSPKQHVYAKDLVLWIIGMIGSDGADYMSIEFHGDGIKHLSVSDRMTIANMASEMGAKNAVFPADDILFDFIGKRSEGTWADPDAVYTKEISINLSDIFPLVAAPHNVDNIKAVAQVEGTMINQAVIGTCTNGRIEDLRIAAKILADKKISKEVQLLIIPASQMIYLLAMEEGLIQTFIKAGANILAPSCGPCLGTGQGIPADGYNIISTANRNFLGRMGNPKSNIYLASPATVAQSALDGYISDPRATKTKDIYPFSIPQSNTVTIAADDNRYHLGVWNYTDADNLNTDQMFAGNLTYNVLSSEAEKIIPNLFEGFDPTFTKKAKENDIIIAGANFGCGSSREHPAVGLAFIGIKAVIVKSVNRIFYRSAVNQGLPILVVPEAVDAYKQGDSVDINFESGVISIGSQQFKFQPLPQKLMMIFNEKGLVNYLKKS